MLVGRVDVPRGRQLEVGRVVPAEPMRAAVDRIAEHTEADAEPSTLPQFVFGVWKMYLSAPWV